MFGTFNPSPQGWGVKIFFWKNYGVCWGVCVMFSSNYGCVASVTVVEPCECGFGVSGASPVEAGVQGRWYAYERVSVGDGVLSRARVPLHWCAGQP